MYLLRRTICRVPQVADTLHLTGGVEGIQVLEQGAPPSPRPLSYKARALQMETHSYRLRPGASIFRCLRWGSIMSRKKRGIE